MTNIDPERDIILMADDPDFSKTGLKATSVLKLTKVSTVRKDLAEGELGELEGSLRYEANIKMRRIFRI